MADSSKIPDMLLTATEVADYLSISEEALAQHRYMGTGLPYVKIGTRVRYRLSVLMQYLEDNTTEVQPVPQMAVNRPARTHRAKRV